MFFGSNYEGLRAENVKSALDGDPRLVMLDLQEIQKTPVIKLAAKYGLIASNCASTLDPGSQPHSHFRFQRLQKISSHLVDFISTIRWSRKYSTLFQCQTLSTSV